MSDLDFIKISDNQYNIVNIFGDKIYTLNHCFLDGGEWFLQDVQDCEIPAGHILIIADFIRSIDVN